MQPRNVHDYGNVQKVELAELYAFIVARVDHDGIFADDKEFRFADSLAAVEVNLIVGMYCDESNVRLRPGLDEELARSWSLERVVEILNS